MWTSPQQTIVAGAPPPNLVFKNPTRTSRSSATTAAQIANVSGWVLSVQTEVGAVTLQPFTASSVPAGVRDVVVTPQVQAYPLSLAYVSVSWMLPGEQPPQPDGPLTASAVAAAATTSTSALVNTTTYNQAAQGNVLTIPGLNVAYYRSLMITVDNTAGANSGHCAVTLAWAVGGAGQVNEIYFTTGQLLSSFIVPCKGPMVDIILKGNNVAFGTVTTLNVTGFINPASNVQMVEASGLPYVFYQNNVPIGAGGQVANILPSFDCFGPAQIAGAMGNLGTGTGGVLLEIDDYDQNDVHSSTSQIAILPSSLGALPPTRFWFSHYRHKLTVFNDSTVPVNAFVNIWPEW